MGSHISWPFTLATGPSSDALPLALSQIWMSSQMPMPAACLLLYSPPPLLPISILCPSPDLFPQAYAESTTILLPEACAVPIPPSTLRSVLCPPPIAAPGPRYAHSPLLSQACAVSLKKSTFSPQNKVLPLYAHSILFFTHFLSKWYHVDFYKTILRKTLSYKSLISIAGAEVAIIMSLVALSTPCGDTLYPHSKSLRKHYSSHRLQTRKWSRSPMKFNTWSQAHAHIWGLSNRTMTQKNLSATGRVLRCDKSHGQGQRKSRSQYPGGKIRLLGLVPLPVDLSKCSLSSLSKLRLVDGGGKGSAPTEERGSNGMLCVMSVTMKRRLGMERQSHQGLQKAPITEYSPCLYPKWLRGQDTS